MWLPSRSAKNITLKTTLEFMSRASANINNVGIVKQLEPIQWFQHTSISLSILWLLMLYFNLLYRIHNLAYVSKRRLPLRANLLRLKLHSRIYLLNHHSLEHSSFASFHWMHSFMLAVRVFKNKAWTNSSTNLIEVFNARNIIYARNNIYCLKYLQLGWLKYLPQ